MAYTTDLIRNLALAGHGSTGKTSLLEHLLFSAGSIQKPELVESGKTVSDYAEEEIERKISVHAALSHANFNNKKFNLLDTPGSSDFIGDVIMALRACESALVLVDARTGVQIETIKIWRNLDSRGKPRMVFVNKLDEDRASFSGALADIKEKSRLAPVAITIPMGEGAAFKGVIDVLNQKAYPVPASGDQIEAEAPVPPDYASALAEARAALSEAAADGDDELMEKYLSEGNRQGPVGGSRLQPRRSRLLRFGPQEFGLSGAPLVHSRYRASSVQARDREGGGQRWRGDAFRGRRVRSAGRSRHQDPD